MSTDWLEVTVTYEDYQEALTSGRHLTGTSQMHVVYTILRERGIRMGAAEHGLTILPPFEIMQGPAGVVVRQKREPDSKSGTTAD